MFKAITKKDHAGFGYSATQAFSFAQNQTILDVADEEIKELLAQYVIVFRKDESGNFQLCALTSLAPGQNWMVHPDGRWLSSYVPAQLRGYPFALLNTENDQTVLCVHENETGFAQERGTAILDEQGELTEKGQQLMSFLTKLKKSFTRTSDKVDLLSEAELITQWPLEIRTEADKPGVKVDGVFKVDTQKLAELPDDQVAKLMKSGALEIVYAHLFSLNNMKKLNQFAQIQSKLNAQSAVEPILGVEDKDHELEFDFGE